jgi:hypothetical protein
MSLDVIWSLTWIYLSLKVLFNTALILTRLGKLRVGVRRKMHRTLAVRTMSFSILSLVHINIWFLSILVSWNPLIYHPVIMFLSRR